MDAAAFSTEFYQPAGAAAPPDSGAGHAWKNGSSFGFHDVLDTLNPLQHLPVVGTLYRWITGDEPGDVARVVGDGLYGGPIGLATGSVAAAIKDETGKDPGEMVMSLLTGRGDTPATLAGAAAPVPAAAPVAVATATAAPTTHNALMTLFKSPPAAAPPQGANAAAEQGVRAPDPGLQRRFHGGHVGQLEHPATAPIPLQLSGPQLPQRFARMPVSANRTPAAPGAPGVASPGSASVGASSTAAATQAEPPPDLSALPQNPTVDIPQRMMDALDKYARMQQQREQRGQQLDVAP